MTRLRRRPAAMLPSAGPAAAGALPPGLAAVVAAELGDETGVRAVAGSLRTPEPTWTHSTGSEAGIDAGSEAGSHAGFDAGFGTEPDWAGEFDRADASENPDPATGYDFAAGRPGYDAGRDYDAGPGYDAGRDYDAGPGYDAGRDYDAGPDYDAGRGYDAGRADGQAAAPRGEASRSGAPRLEVPRAEVSAGSLGERAGHGPEAAGAVSDGPATSAPGAAVVTEAGRYLQAAGLEDAPNRLDTPTGQIDDTARRIWEIAFGLMVRRRFDPDSPLPEITRTVTAAVRDHALVALPPLDAEMLVRAALRETVPVSEIDPAVRVAVHLLLFASLADELALDEDELDNLIAEAEALS